MKRLHNILFFLLFALSLNAQTLDTIRYVSPSGRFSNDGKTWATAKNNVQDAINDLNEYLVQNGLTGGSVYIAAGTYIPSESTESSGGSLLNTSFKIYNGIHVFGGFNPDAPEAKPSLRKMGNDKTWEENWASRPRVGVATAEEVAAMWDFKYQTILSGNHSNIPVSFTYDSVRGRFNTVFPACSFHVVWFATNGEITTSNDSLAHHFLPLTSPAWIDGCTIRGGNASNRSTARREHTSYGGGAYMVGNSSLINCTVEFCAATIRGGGVYMDGGGMVEHCYIHTCEAGGVGIVQGYGGGVCIDYDGAVQHSYIIQCTSRIGAGLAICHVPREYPWQDRIRARYGREPVASDQISYYNPYATACVISNNTTNAEAGGVYLDEGGTINHCTIVRNRCIGPDVTYYGRRHGRSGGIYIRNCGMMYNSVVWGNECTYNNDMQFASIMQEPDDDHQVYIYHCGFMNHDITDWNNVLKDMVYNVEKSNFPIKEATDGIFPCFTDPVPRTGVLTAVRDHDTLKMTYPTLHPEFYPLARIWHPKPYTSLMGKGVQVTDAVQGASRWIKHAHTKYDIVGNSFEPISSIGALVRDNEKTIYAMVDQQGKEKRDSAKVVLIPTIFVDPNRKSVFDGEDNFVERTHVGQSWDNPLGDLGHAIEYFRDFLIDDPGGQHHYRLPEYDEDGNETGDSITANYVQLLVKEGTLTTSGPGNYLGDELRTASVRVESRMRLYGGYPTGNTGINIAGRNPNEHVSKITANITGALGEEGYKNNSAHVIAFVNVEHAIVDGFRLYNANTHGINSTASVHAGGGVLVNNATTPAAKRIHMTGNELRNCAIAHCSSPKGAAIYVNGEYPLADGTISFAELKVENCVIRNNTSDFENETTHQVLTQSHGVITANGRAYIDINHCTVANNVGYPFKADNRTTDTDAEITCTHPEHDYHGFHGFIRVNNTIIFCNGDRKLDDRGSLHLVGKVTSVNPDGQDFVFGTYNIFDYDIVLHEENATQPHGFFKSDFTLTKLPSDFVPAGVTSTISEGVASGDWHNQCIFTRTDSKQPTYPVFENPARNVGNAFDSDMPLYGGSISYRPLNLNPCVNAASDASMSGYDRTDVIHRNYGGAADIGAIENTNLPAIGTVLYVTPDGAGKRDGSSWGNAIAGNTVYQLSSVAGPALAAGDQIDSEPTCDRVLDSEGNPVLTTNEKYNGGWGRAYLTSKTESVTTTLTTDADVTETVIYTGGGPNDRTETLAPYHETKSDVTTISSGTPDGFTPGYDYLVTYPYGEISGASRSFWRANPYTGTLATYGNGSPASFIAACNANGWINNTRAERYVSGLQYAVERASETNALYHKDSVQVWVGAGKYTDYKGFVMRDTVTVLGGFPTGKYAAPGLSERQALMSDVISIPKSKPAKDFDATDYETILQISDVNPKQDNTHLNDSAVKYWDDDYAADIITDTETIQTATITRTTTYTWETASEEVTSTYIRYADMLYKAPSTNVFAKATRNRVDREGNIISNHITMTNEVFGGLNWTEGQLVVYQFFGPAKSTSNPWPDANGNRSWELAYEDRSNNVDYNVWGFDASRDVLDAGGSKIGTVPRGMLLQGVMNTMSVWQTLKNVPAGDYKLEIDLGAYYTRFVNDENTGITFYILTSNGDTVAQQAVYCKDDKLRRYEFSFTQPADGDIIIRMMSESGSHATDPAAGNFSTSSNNWRKVCMANVHLFLLTGQNYVPSEPVDVTTVTSSSAPQVKTYALYTPATHRTTLRKRVLTMPDVCVPTYGGGGIGDPVSMGNAFSSDALPHTDRVKGATKALRTAATLAKQEDPHYVEYNDANWDGFTIRHGFLYDEGMAHGGGSGVNMYEGAHLRNCIVIHNMSACRNVKGGGIFCDGATSTIEGCFVLDNTSTQGTVVKQDQIFAGGMFMYEGTCFNSLFANNYSYGSAGGLGFCVGRFFNNTVAYNTATLVENGRISGGAISLATSSNPNLFVANTIIYGNNGVAIRDRDTDYRNVNPFIHCYIQSEVKQPNDATNRNVGNYGTKTGNKDNYGVNNIYINGEAPTKYNTPFEADLSPLTGEYTGNAQLYNDYRLLNKGDSSCVNHGIDEFGETFYTALRNKGKSDTDIRNSFIYQIVDTAELPQSDVAFADRVQDCQIDIGAYEYDGAKNILPDITTHPGYAIFYVSHNGAYNGNASADSPKNAACKGKLQKVLDAAGRYKYALMTEDRYSDVAAEPVANQPDKSWIVQVRLAGDPTGNQDPNSTPDSYEPTRSTLYDNTNIADNILDYSLIIPHGVQVLGGYSTEFYHYEDDEGNVYFEPDEDLTLKDERDPLAFRTVFSGYLTSSTGASGRVYHVITFTNNLIDITQKTVDEGGQFNIPAYNIEDHRAVIDGIFITGGEANSADEENKIGAGAVVTDFSHIRNCVITGNTAAGYGGGLYLKPGALVSGTIVKNNSAAIGGGIYIEISDGSVLDTARIIASTICDNHANTRAGGVWFKDNVRINSCAIWHNSSNDNANIAGQFAGTTYGYPVVFTAVEVNKLEGVGNIELSPIASEGVRWDAKDPFATMTYYPIEMSSTLARAGMTYYTWRQLYQQFTTLDSIDIAGVSRTAWIVPGIKRGEYWYHIVDGETVFDTLACKLNDFIEIGARAFDGTYEIKIDNEHVMYRLFVVHTDLLDTKRARALQDNPDVNSNTPSVREKALMYRQMGSCMLNPFHRLTDAFDYIIQIRKNNPKLYRNARFEVFVEAGTYYPFHNAYGEEGQVRTNTFVIPEGVTVIGGVNHRLDGRKYCQAGYQNDYYGNIPRINGYKNDTLCIDHDGFRDTIVLNNATTDSIRDLRPVRDYNYNSVIEPWEFSEQTTLSGEAVYNNQATNVYHVITCHADSTQIGAQPYMFEHYNESTHQFEDTIPFSVKDGDGFRMNVEGFALECENSKVARAIILDGLTVKGGNANAIAAEDAAAHEYMKKTYFRGGGIFVDGNWTEDFNDPTNPFIPHVTDPAPHDIPMLVRNCQFQDNSAANGGAIYSNGKLQVFGSHFTQNQAIGPTIPTDQLYIPWSAGACIAANTYCGVTNCLFDNNEAKRGKYPIVVKGDEEIPNADARQGFAGVISASVSSRVRALNCHFVNNKAVAYPAIYNFWPNNYYTDPDSMHFAVNCLFWGNEGTGILKCENASSALEESKATFATNYEPSRNGVFHYDGANMDEFNRLLAEYNTLYEHYVEVQDTFNTEVLDKLAELRELGNKIEGLYFCAYRRGYGLDAARSHRGYLMTKAQSDDFVDAKQKAVPTKILSNGDEDINYTDLFSYVCGNNNIILNRKNDAIDGPNFVQPSNLPGTDGYMQNADWLLSRINALTDAGWGYYKQEVHREVDHYEWNSPEQAIMLPDDPLKLKLTVELYEDSLANFPDLFHQDKWYPVYALEKARFVEPDNKALYNYQAHHFRRDFRYPLAPEGDETYMLYNRIGDRLQRYMNRISANPRLGVEDLYIDMGIYEYQYVQLDFDGSEVDTIWVTDSEVAGENNNGLTYEKATSDINHAIYTLLRSHNNHDKYICFKEGEYSPNMVIDGRRSFVIDVPTDYLEVQLPRVGETDKDYYVKSITFLGGWSPSSKGEGRNPEAYPTVITMSEGENNTMNQLFHIADMTRQNMRRTFRADDMTRDTTVIPVAFDGLIFENNYARADLNSGAMRDEGGAAIYYRMQRQHTTEADKLTIIDSIPLYPTREVISIGDTIDIPKLIISNCQFRNNGQRTSNLANRPSAVRIGDGGGYSLIVNSLFHSNAGCPLWAPLSMAAQNNKGRINDTPNTVHVVNCTFALNEGYTILPEPHSQVHNSLFWKEDLLNDTTTQLAIGTQQWKRGLAAPQKNDSVTYNAMYGVDFDADLNHNENLVAENKDLFNGPNFVNPIDTAVTHDTVRRARDFHLKPSVRTMDMADTTIYRNLVFSRKYLVPDLDGLWARPFAIKHELTTLRNDSDLASKPRLLGVGMERGAYECQAKLQRVLYVQPNKLASVDDDGSSWAKAFGQGQMQDAISSAAIYTYMHRNAAEPEDRRSYVFVKGMLDAQNDEDISLLPGVQIYGGVPTTFFDTVAYNEVLSEYTNVDCQNFVAEVQAVRPGVAAPNTAKSRINSISSEYSGTFTTDCLIDGFIISNVSKANTAPVVSLDNQLNIIRNSIFTNNLVTGGEPVLNLNRGLIYNSLFYGNNADTHVRVGANGLVLNCTFDADRAGQTALDASDASAKSVVNTITVNEADNELSRVGTDAFVRCNGKLGMFAQQLRSTYTYPTGTLPNHLMAPANQALWYQLHDRTELIDQGLETIWFSGVKNNNLVNAGFETYTDFIDFSADRDVLGNPRRVRDSVDLGCFETWSVDGLETASNQTNALFTTNYGGHYYPHAGSVVYIEKDSYLNVALNGSGNPLFNTLNPIQPAYLLVKDGGSLYGNGNVIRAEYVAVEKVFNNQQYSMTALPYAYTVANALSQTYNPTTDGVTSSPRRSDFDAYYYSGSDRAQYNYVFQRSNSYAWKAFTKDSVKANDGWLLDFTETKTADTIIFTGWSPEAGAWLYTEDGNEKLVVLNQYDHRTDGVNGSGMDFTRLEDMGWNMRGMPYLVSDYATAIDGIYQMHIPHLIYQMSGAGDYLHEIIESREQIFTHRSWIDGTLLTLGNAWFTQTADILPTETLRFNQPMYAQKPARAMRPLVHLANSDGKGDIMEVVPDSLANKNVVYGVGRDGIKWRSENHTQVWINDGTNRISMSMLASAPTEVDMNVGVFVRNFGEFTFSLPEPEAFEPYTAVWLTDTKANRVVNLLRENYSCDILPGVDIKRFKLRIGGYPLGKEGKREYISFAYEKTLYVRGLVDGDRVCVYAADGKKVADFIATKTEYHLPLPQGMFVVNVNSEYNNKVVSM